MHLCTWNIVNGEYVICFKLERYDWDTAANADHNYLSS